MPRKKLIKSDLFPYHVTIRANNRERFHLALHEVWKIIESESLTLRTVYGVEFQNLVLMPNHIHMIVTIPEFDLGKTMSVYFSNLTKKINWASGRSGHVFGGPYFWSIITSTRYYGHALKYVYRNPVRAGLCTNIEDYPFSTAPGIFGIQPLGFPLNFTRIGMEVNIPDPHQPFEWLEWLNRPFTKEAEELIRLCLRKKEMTTLMNRSTRRPEPLLEDLL